MSISFFTLQSYDTKCWTTFILLSIHINDPGDSGFCLQFYGHLNTAGPPIPQLKRASLVIEDSSASGAIP